MAKYNQKVLGGIYKRVVGAMSGLQDINVEIHPQIVPHWDPNQNTIRMPSTVSFASNDEEDFKFGRGIVVHEAGHVLFCPKVEIDDDDLAEWFNVFADANNEWKVSQLWNHLGVVLSDKTEALIKKRPDILQTKSPFMQSLLRCDGLIKSKAEFPVDYSPKLKKFVEQTEKEWIDENVREAGGQELIEFTNRINDRWKKLKDNYGNQKKNGGKKINELMKDIGKMIAGGKSSEEIEEKENEIEAERQKIEANNPNQGEIDRSFLAEVNVAGEYGHLSLDELKEMLKKKKIETDGAAGGWGCEEFIKSARVTPRRPEGMEVENFDQKLAYKQGKRINRVLKRKVNLQEDFEKRHRNGRIDLEEIRRQIGQMGRIYKETVFERNNNFTRGGEWVCEVLIDCSGSMSGPKIGHAKQALATLAYALDGLPNVKYVLTGFTDFVDIQVKKFTEKFNLDRLKQLRAENGNCDGHNIRSAIRRLNKFKNVKKLLVVISDGQPAYINGIDDTKRAVEVAEHYGIKVLGVGIKGCTEKALEEIYPNRYMFQDTENLHKELTTLILERLGQKEKVKLVKRCWE